MKLGHNVILTATLAFLSGPVLAQQGPPPSGSPQFLFSVQPEQYKEGFIEFGGSVTGAQPNTQFTLRCGYNGSNGAPDLSFAYVQVRNPNAGLDTRYWSVDGKSVMAASTTRDNRFSFVATAPDGSVQARNCMINSTPDKARIGLSGCTPATPVLNAQQIAAQVNSTVQQCGPAMSQMVGQITSGGFDPQRYQQFRQDMHDMLAALGFGTY